MNPNTLAVWKNVETRLDVPFRRNMVDLLLEMARDQTADPQKIATWMMTTSLCICYAIFGSCDPTPLLSHYMQALETQYPQTIQAIYEIWANDQLRTYFLPSSLSHNDFIGILWAAGATFTNGELTLIDNKISATQKGMQRLQSIWKTPVSKIHYPQQ